VSIEQPKYKPFASPVTAAIAPILEVFPDYASTLSFAMFVGGAIT
jgi:hypothetical protein